MISPSKVRTAVRYESGFLEGHLRVELSITFHNITLWSKEYYMKVTSTPRNKSGFLLFFFICLNKKYFF